MILAIASGKGGSGKTRGAVGLALAAPPPVRLLDCDVEGPNCHLFLAPLIESTEPVPLPCPVVDPKRCTACGECARLCAYNAIAVLGRQAVVFPELCHSCGGCARVCPAGAIRETGRPIGSIQHGWAGGVELIQGRLDVGEAQSPPLIQALKRRGAGPGLTLLDCPPGTSCPVVAALRGADFALLVSEPTPFGLNDLALAVETARGMGIPLALVLNRAGSGDDRTSAYCRAEGIEILLEIPEDRRIAEACSRGLPAEAALPGLREAFRGLLERVEARTRSGAGREPW